MVFFWGRFKCIILNGIDYWIVLIGTVKYPLTPNFVENFCLYVSILLALYTLGSILYTLESIYIIFPIYSFFFIKWDLDYFTQKKSID